MPRCWCPGDSCSWLLSLLVGVNGRLWMRGLLHAQHGGRRQPWCTASMACCARARCRCASDDDPTAAAATDSESAPAPALPSRSCLLVARVCCSWSVSLSLMLSLSLLSPLALPLSISSSTSGSRRGVYRSLLSLRIVALVARRGRGMGVVCARRRRAAGRPRPAGRHLALPCRAPRVAVGPCFVWHGVYTYMCCKIWHRTHHTHHGR